MKITHITIALITILAISCNPSKKMSTGTNKAAGPLLEVTGTGESYSLNLARSAAITDAKSELSQRMLILFGTIDTIISDNSNTITSYSFKIEDAHKSNERFFLKKDDKGSNSIYYVETQLGINYPDSIINKIVPKERIDALKKYLEEQNQKEMSSDQEKKLKRKTEKKSRKEKRRRQKQPSEELEIEFNREKFRKYAEEKMAEMKENTQRHGYTMESAHKEQKQPLKEDKNPTIRYLYPNHDQPDEILPISSLFAMQEPPLIDYSFDDDEYSRGLGSMVDKNYMNARTAAIFKAIYLIASKTNLVKSLTLSFKTDSSSKKELERISYQYEDGRFRMTNTKAFNKETSSVFDTTFFTEKFNTLVDPISMADAYADILLTSSICKEATFYDSIRKEYTVFVAIEMPKRKYFWRDSEKSEHQSQVDTLSLKEIEELGFSKERFKQVWDSLNSKRDSLIQN